MLLQSYIQSRLSTPEKINGFVVNLEIVCLPYLSFFAIHNITLNLPVQANAFMYFWNDKCTDNGKVLITIKGLIKL